MVRARGTAGGESITLRVNNSNVATWTLTTSLPELQRIDDPQRQRHRGIHNDATAATCRWTTSSSTGNPPVGKPDQQHRVYANGSCGGGSNSEWLHCNGAIAYGPALHFGNSIVVRARARLAVSPQLAGQQHQRGDLDADDGSPELQRVHDLTGASPSRSPMTPLAATCRWTTSSSTDIAPGRGADLPTPGSMRTAVAAAGLQ